MKLFNMLAFGLALASSGLATAQQVRIETQTTTTTAPAAGPSTTIVQTAPAAPVGVRKVSQILGSTVQLQDGSGFGKVDDIVLDEEGRIDYLVVSRDNQVAVMPYDAARVDYGRRVVVYDVTPQAAQPLFFAPTAWPNLADPQFSRRMEGAFGPRAMRRQVRVQGAPPVAVPGDVEKVKIKDNGNRVKIKVKDRD